MPTLHLLCGLPGSGKTTFARDLAAKQPVLRLTEDEWMARLFGSDSAGNDDQRGRVSALQWDIAEQALRCGADVVLDWGFWFRAERDAARQRAAALGATPETWFFDTPLAVIKRRLAHRNTCLHATSFIVRPDQIDAWSRVFEPPDTRERVHRVVASTPQEAQS